MPDLLVVVLLAAGSALAIALLGVLALRLLSRRSLVLSTTVVALVGVVGVLAAALVAAKSMFLSQHDLGVLVVVCLVAGGVGVLTAVVLARAVVAGSHALGLAAASLGDGSYTSAGSLPAELAALDRQLAEASARLEASRDRERALEGSRRELVAWISHDLRTPLAGIRAMAEALEDGIVDDPATVDRYHASVRREADRLASMVDDLFELSRINAATLSLTLEQVSLGDLVSDAIASASPVAAAKGVRLESADLEGLPPVEGSVRELGRVLRNLLSNAIRHTPADGVVSVQAGSQDGQAYLVVADACGGIPAEDLPRVFDIAFRGTAARTPADDGGAGLGLAIARGLVEAHRGDITIENDGPGCRVLVRIPAGDGIA
ncbi:MAG: Two-component sensor histidine kinase [Frankiales bacterium]|nr:Two-component sensor histidine kinase [Frankiales bacterium]